MKLDVALRLSHYLTLALACGCMGLAVLPPRLNLLVVVCLLMELLVVAMFVNRDGTWSAPKETVFRWLIVVGAGLFTAFYLSVCSENAEFPLCLSIPLLLPGVLWLKRVGYFWGVQCWGLTAMILGCALNDNPLNGLILLLYLACGLWTLALFHMHHQRQSASMSIAPQPTSLPTQVRPPEPAIPWRYLGWKHVSRWTLLVAFLGLVLILLTPERGSSWLTGFSANSIDLNQTGTLELNRNPAMLVTATEADGSPKLDLDCQLYWRGTTLDCYHRGRWNNQTFDFRESLVLPRDYLNASTARLPDLGPNQVFLTCNLLVRPSSVVFVVEPVDVKSHPEQQPVVTLAEDGLVQRCLQRKDGTYQSIGTDQDRPIRYRQVLLPDRVSRDDSASEVNDDDIQRFLQTPDLHRLRMETRHVLFKLIDASERKLGPKDPLPLDKHEEVALALQDHLKDSGEYRYSLDLRRQDMNLDPVEDFLCNVKRGHCGRFAAALTLMLRSQGIPARIVLGFHGAEPQGGGNYLVRSLHAHSWVEALIPMKKPEGDTKWYWLRLDPTPSALDPLHHGGGSGWGPSWFSSWSRSSSQQILWSELEGPSGDSRGSFRQRLRSRIGLDRPTDSTNRQPRSLREDEIRFGMLLVLGLVGVLALLLGFWLVRRYWPRSNDTIPAPVFSGDDFYQRLLAILSSRCELNRQPAQTAREFADLAEANLRVRLAIAVLVSVPNRVVNLYYRLRFGRLALSVIERQTIDDEVAQLEIALAGSPIARPAPVEKRPPVG